MKAHTKMREEINTLIRKEITILITISFFSTITHVFDRRKDLTQIIIIYENIMFFFSTFEKKSCIIDSLCAPYERFIFEIFSAHVVIHLAQRIISLKYQRYTCY